MHKSLHRFFILHSRAYRETSAIITAFSLESGKISFVAKGVKSTRNKLRVLTEPFIPMTVELSGNSELKNSYSMDSDGMGMVLSGIHLYCGIYINELLTRVLPSEEPDQALYSAYQQTITRLSKQESPEPILREFEFFLLQQMGYAVEFNVDAESGDDIDEFQRYRYVAETGLIKTKQMGSKHSFSGADLRDISHQNWHAASLLAAKQISRLAFAPLLGAKPLKSRELFQAAPKQ